MRKILQQAAMLTLLGTMTMLSGCGEGTPDEVNNDSNNSPPKQTQTGPSHLAPASIGGKTVTGRIGTTSTTFRIVTSGTTSGTYSYSENGVYLNNGSYNWVKTSGDSGMLTLTPDN